MRHDLPAGGKRLLQRADGYATTIVKGQVTYQHGEPTDALPGRLLRGADGGARADDRRPRVLEERCAWRSDELGDAYVWELTDADRAELDAALEHAEAAHRRHARHHRRATSRSRPSGPAWREVAARARSTAAASRSSAACPSTGSARSARRPSTGASGAHLGRPWPQNAKGHLLGDVTDQGKTGDDPTSRGNEIGGVAFPFHSDGSDLVGLFCLDAGASGGASLVANAVTIHNELVRTDARAGGRALRRRSPTTSGARRRRASRPWYLMPLFTERNGRLFVRYIRPVHPVGPPPRRRAARPARRPRAAMDRVDAMCADPQFHLSMQLEPGDMQFVNNYHVLHARDAYTDDRATGAVRHLKRLWLETDVLTDDDKPEAFRLTRHHRDVVEGGADRVLNRTTSPHAVPRLTPCPTAADLADRFRALHEGPEPLVMPNPWDVGSARLLAHLGFQALATTSSGFAGTLGRLDGNVTRDEALAARARPSRPPPTSR